jgi:N6-L-threonylcarbamoyladenine synthase
MYILAFETSCDDTSVALMNNGVLIAMSTRTQLEHDSTWWVVPEVAARSHANAIFPCIEDVLSEAQIGLEEIDFFACTEKPGLLPSLLTGLTVAKSLALSLSKPLILVDHIESHIFANLLERKISEVCFPAVVLTVSGWHTEIYHWKSLFELDLLWQTRDDAAWECFDKVAKMMWLGFPGGAKIAKLASEYRNKISSKNISKSWLFPRVMLEKSSLDFSFSGLKTAVKREIDMRLERNASQGIWNNKLSEWDMCEIAYELEEAIGEILAKKLILAHTQMGTRMMCLAGWVSANSHLKSILSEYGSENDVLFLAPVKNLYSMDNAAMVGIRAYYEITSQKL